jgi:hypothetical protein
MDSINKNAERERQEVFPCALSPELCATSCPDLSLTERRYAYAKIAFFYNSGSGPTDATSSARVINLTLLHWSM